MPQRQTAGLEKVFVTSSSGVETVVMKDKITPTGTAITANASLDDEGRHGALHAQCHRLLPARFHDHPSGTFDEDTDTSAAGAANGNSVNASKFLKVADFNSTQRRKQFQQALFADNKQLHAAADCPLCCRTLLCPARMMGSTRACSHYG